MVTTGSSSSSLGVRSQGPLARPSYSRSGSSSSSLSGMEQAIQPFQDFIKQTRPIEADKPLPPTPLAPRQTYESSRVIGEGTPEMSYYSRPAADRRSSSVYSRTQSQWIPNEQSAESLDTSYESYLGPESYSTIVPDLNIRQATPDCGQPRHCSPLIVSPSPTLSAVSTLPRSRPPTMMLSEPARERPKARLMSLDKANRTFKAPGMVHLLPEELRAQSLKKSEARKHSRMESQQMFSMFSSPRPPPLPPAALIHEETRSYSTSTGESVSPHTILQRDGTPQSSNSDYMTSMKAFHVGAGPSREMLAPLASERPQRTEDEDRGRSRQRGHSSREYPAPQKFFMHDLNPRPIHENREDSPRQLSASGSYDSDDDVRGHMKMIPQPLFQAKSPIQHRRPSDARVTSPLSPLGNSGFRMQRESQESASSTRSSGFPLRLSLTPPPGGIRHRQSKSSTTGMIPISPPSGNSPGEYHIPTPIDTRQNPFSKPTFEDETKVSSICPRLINQNRKKKTKPDVKLAAKRPSIGAPLLPPEVVAAVLLTPETTPQTSPLASNLLLDGLKRTPSGLSAEVKKPLYQRFKGMAKQIRRGSKQEETSPAESPIASPQSPHLFASPVKTSQPTHLGWTDTAKATWDQARATANTLRRNASHVTSHDDGEVGDEDEDVAAARRPTLFGPFVEGYRETRAQKRREDLKKTIKVVTPLEQTSEAGESDEESERDSVVQKRLSGYNWM